MVLHISVSNVILLQVRSKTKNMNNQNIASWENDDLKESWVLGQNEIDAI
jgi:hypothetical protein